MLKIACHVSRGSRGRRRVLQGGPKPSGRSRPAPVETPLVLSYPPNPHLTPARPAPTGTTERLTIQPTNDILVVMVGGIKIVRIDGTLRDNEHLFILIYKSSQSYNFNETFFFCVCVSSQKGEIGRGTVNTHIQATATSPGRGTDITRTNSTATRTTMIGAPTETCTAAQVLTATTSPPGNGHMSTTMTGTTGATGLTTTGELLGPEHLLLVALIAVQAPVSLFNLIFFQAFR